VSYGPNNFVGSTSGTAGSADGTGSNASFNNPTWIVGDGSGNYYVSDTGNHTIRKVTSTGVVTTVFGTAGTPGSSLSTLNSPRGIALDSSNNLYVADYSNSRVLYISNGSSTGSNIGTVSNVVQVAANSNGSNLLIMTNLTQKNLYQYRNGAFDGLMNLNFNSNGIYYVINASSVAYSPNGSFYFTTTAAQYGNQVGMYRMGSFQAPTAVNLNIVTITQSAAGENVSITFPVGTNVPGAGFTTGTPFNFFGFAAAESAWTQNSGSYSDLISYTATVSSSSGSNLTFRYSPISNYPTGTPNTSATISNSTYGSYSNILAIGWDTFITTQGNGVLAPQDMFRMNFYFTDSNSVWPGITTSGSGGASLDGLTITFAGLTGTFATYNGSYSGTTYIGKVYDAIDGTSRVTFTLGSTSGSSATQTYTNKLTSTAGIVGFILIGPGVPYGTVVLTDSNPSGTSGTITLSAPITSTNSTYYISTWPFSSTRVVQLMFPQVACPTGSYNANYRPTKPAPYVTATIISNTLTGVSVDGAPYGYNIANLQYIPPNSNFFYASSQRGMGIQKYTLTGDTAVSSDTNAYTGNPTSFSVLIAPTTEVITIVPTSNSSNNIVKYQRSY
jgi:hypothetical protein